MPLDPTLGEIALFAFTNPMRGWALCNGQLMSIQQNSALYALLGTRFGGDGKNNFALPDLRNRVPVGAAFGSAPPGLTPYPIGQSGGSATVTLTANQLPPHSHAFFGATAVANSNQSQGNAYATVAADPPNFPNAPPIYGGSNALTSFDPATVMSTGGGQPHTNMQPTLTLCYMIATQGIFPNRS